MGTCMCDFEFICAHPTGSYDNNFEPEAELKRQIHSSFNSPLALRRNSLLSPLPLSLKTPSSTPVAMTTATQSQSVPGLWKRVEPEPTGPPLDKLLRSLESGLCHEHALDYISPRGHCD